MSDPQIWTVIGVLTPIMLGGMTLMVTLINRTMAAGFKAVDARFDSLEFRLEHLDRDVAAIARQVWGGDRRNDS